MQRREVYQSVRAHSMTPFMHAMACVHDALAAREMMIEQLIERGARTNRSDLDDNIAAYARLNAELPCNVRRWRSHMRFQFEDWQRRFRNKSLSDSDKGV